MVSPARRVVLLAKTVARNPYLGVASSSEVRSEGHRALHDLCDEAERQDPLAPPNLCLLVIAGGYAVAPHGVWAAPTRQKSLDANPSCGELIRYPRSTEAGTENRPLIGDFTAFLVTSKYAIIGKGIRFVLIRFQQTPRFYLQNRRMCAG